MNSLAEQNERYQSLHMHGDVTSTGNDVTLSKVSKESGLHIATVAENWRLRTPKKLLNSFPPLKLNRAFFSVGQRQPF